MDAPKCQKIPSCGKRHWGECASAATQEARPKKAKKPDLAAYGSRLENAAKLEQPADYVMDARTPEMKREANIQELLARVESLESRVKELETRKRYMRDYMARKRAEGKG